MIRCGEEYFSDNQVYLQTVIIKIHNDEIDVIIATYLFFTDVTPMY